MKIENQIIEVKGKGQPDQLADRFSEVAIEAILEHSPDLYANIDTSYLKAGRFPEFIVGGQMSYDFNKYTKEDRYELENHVKYRLFGSFKEIFPNARLNVDFQLALFPNLKEELILQGRFDDTTSATAFYPFTEDEEFAMKLSDKIEELKYAGLDYKINVFPDEVIISQCFFDDNELSLERYVNDLNEFVLSTNRTLHVNPDYNHINKMFWNRYGSSVFSTESGVTGRGNNNWGFSSPQRQNVNSTTNGKYPYGASKKLYEFALEIAKREYKETGEPVEVTTISKIGTHLDNYSSIIKRI